MFALKQDLIKVSREYRKCKMNETWERLITKSCSSEVTVCLAECSIASAKINICEKILSKWA